MRAEARKIAEVDVQVHEWAGWAPALRDPADNRSMIAPPLPVRRPWNVGVSGASGTPYAAATIRGLLDAGEDLDLVVSRAARLTILDETGISFRDAHWREDLAVLLGWPTDHPRLDAVRYWPAGDFAAGPSSGSYPARGMVVVPASTAAV